MYYINTNNFNLYVCIYFLLLVSRLWILMNAYVIFTKFDTKKNKIMCNMHQS